MNTSKKAQASIEVLVYLAFFMFIFVIISIFFLMQQGNDIRAMQYKYMKEVAGSISDNIEMAALFGPGFNSTFEIPREIMGKQYTVNITSNGGMYVTVKIDSGVGNAFTPDLVMYYPIGRGNIYPNKKLGADGKNYQTDEGTMVRYVWFDTEKGSMRITVVDENGAEKIYIG